MTLGVTAKSTYRSPNIDRMTEEAKKECFLNRAFIALFVAVHRGHVPLIKALLDRTGLFAVILSGLLRVISIFCIEADLLNCKSEVALFLLDLSTIRSTPVDNKSRNEVCP